MSKKYKFPLESLLNIRKLREDEVKKSFSKSLNEMTIIELELNSLKSDYVKYNSLDEDESIFTKKVKRNYLTSLNTKIGLVETNLEEKSNEVEMKRKQLQKKSIEKKTVEILKEKSYIEYLKSQNRIEQAQNDEFGLNIYIKSLEGGDDNNDTNS